MHPTISVRSADMYIYCVPAIIIVHLQIAVTTSLISNIVVQDHSYVISKSGKRLLAGDACFNISRVINDTDGRGHSTLPRHFHLPHWLSIGLWLLVCPSQRLAAQPWPEDASWLIWNITRHLFWSD